MNTYTTWGPTPETPWTPDPPQPVSSELNTNAIAFLNEDILGDLQAPITADYSNLTFPENVARLEIRVKIPSGSGVEYLNSQDQPLQIEVEAVRSPILEFTLLWTPTEGGQIRTQTSSQQFSIDQTTQLLDQIDEITSKIQAPQLTYPILPISANVYKQTLNELLGSLPASIDHLEVAVDIAATDIANLNLDGLVTEYTINPGQDEINQPPQIFTKFLAQHFSVSYFPITDPTSSPLQLGHSRVSTFGNINNEHLIASIFDYSSGDRSGPFPDLPGTAIESQILVALFPSLMKGSVTDDSNSNITTIQNGDTVSWLRTGNIANNRDGQNPNFIHMSLHSNSSEKKVNNGFQLPDGSSTDFSNVELDDVELMFLNTCQSGHIRVPFASPYISLAHSAISQGAKNVIAPTYAIPDWVAPVFAAEFYSQLAETGDIAKALQATKVSFMNKETYFEVVTDERSEGSNNSQINIHLSNDKIIPIAGADADYLLNQIAASMWQPDDSTQVEQFLEPNQIVYLNNPHNWAGYKLYTKSSFALNR